MCRHLLFDCPWGPLRLDATRGVVVHAGSFSFWELLRLSLSSCEELTTWRWWFKATDRPALDSLRIFFLAHVPAHTPVRMGLTGFPPSAPS
jgi:hypothetical protein